MQAISSSSSLSQEPGQIARRIFFTQQLYMLFGAAPLVYLMLLISGLNGEQSREVALLLLPLLTGVLGVAAPYGLTYVAVKRAFREVPGEPPGTRLARILQVPSIIEAGMLVITVMTVTTFVGTAAVRYGKSLWTIPWAIVALGLQMMLLLLQERISFQSLLLPYAIKEFHRAPTIAPRGSGFLWPRQSWLLPYAFAVFVVCSVVTTGTVIITQMRDIYWGFMGQLDTLRPEQFAPLMRSGLSEFNERSFLPVILLGSYMMISAATTAWRLARHQTEAARRVQSAMEGLARGRPVLPDWISTDEMGDLSAATAGILEQLEAFSVSLQSSAQALRDSAQQFGLSSSQQTEVLTQQAAALQETQVTAQEIKHTSVLASQKAEAILKQTERADQLSVSGESTLQQGLAGMEEIGSQVREMATSIRSLDDRARQIAHITTLVKGLADRSNMLALNAAIESVRSGEAGKGFGVVAREIRTLADQSIKATRDITDILQDLGSAIGSAVSLMDQGSDRMEVSLKQIRDFSVQVRQITSIVRDNAASVRQITVAVGQQDVGIAQIFEAVSDLSKGMDQTMNQLRASDNVISQVRGVAEQVSSVVDDFGWREQTRESRS